MKTMRNLRAMLSKVMLTTVAAVVFVGNSIPAFAASDVLANGYEDVYEGTSDLSSEAQEIRITFNAEGYEVNEAGEIEIPADQVNPEGLPEIVMGGDERLRTLKFYEWDVPANTYSRSFDFTCQSGGRIGISVVCDHTIQAGIIEPNGDRRCVIDSGVFSHTFTLDQTGTYNFYVKNTNDFAIHLEASVAY